MSQSLRLLSGLFNLVFPDDCRICEKPLCNVSRIPVCPSCLSSVEPLGSEFFCLTCHTPFRDPLVLDELGQCSVCRLSQANFDAAYSFGLYEGTLQKLIQVFKYGKVESLAGPLSRLLLQSLPAGEDFDLIIAMPMHWRKHWERGFNQAELLARLVARRLGLKLAGNLRRRRHTKAQAGLDERERQLNLKYALAVRRPSEIAGKRVLLIDDVFTTGATLRAATEALKEAGAIRVVALTLAKVDRRPLFVSASRRTRRRSAESSFEKAFGPLEERKTQTAGTGAK